MASTADRGYGGAHQKLRREWAKKVATGTVQCPHCPFRIQPGQAWDLDHADDRRGYRGPAHAKCNRRVGGIKGNQSWKRKRRRRLRSSGTTGLTW